MRQAQEVGEEVLDAPLVPVQAGQSRGDQAVQALPLGLRDVRVTVQVRPESPGRVEVLAAVAALRHLGGQVVEGVPGQQLLQPRQGPELQPALRASPGSALVRRVAARQVIQQVGRRHVGLGAARAGTRDSVGRRGWVREGVLPDLLVLAQELPAAELIGAAQTPVGHACQTQPVLLFIPR